MPIFFTHSSIVGHLGCFKFWITKNKFAVDIQVFVWIYVFISPRSGMTGSCGKCIFNFLRNGQIVFWNGSFASHSHQKCSSYFTISAILGIVSLFNFSHFSVWVIVSFCSFCLHLCVKERECLLYIHAHVSDYTCVHMSLCVWHTYWEALIYVYLGVKQVFVHTQIGRCICADPM